MHEQMDNIIADTMARARDVSVRDGVQSKFANKVRNTHIFKILAAENELAAAVRNAGTEMAPVEVWGGGQVLQPANFLKEDPFVNLEEMHRIAPELQLQCLNRGRQCWGFGPVSAEIIEAGLQAASDRGLKVVRVFDMMNDARNLEATFEAVKNINAGRPANDRLIIEGAVSYNSEPREGERAWTIEEYADYAVKLAQMGANEIVIKNYAGTGKYEMVELIHTIRGKLDAAGFEKIPLNLHMHGQYPELMADALEAGANKVDVAMGKLAGGPSFTDLIALLEERLKRAGIDTSKPEIRAEFEANPIVQRIRDVEKVIHEELAVQQKEAPIPSMKEFNEEQIETYRMAAGALSDVWTRIAGMARDGKVNIGKVELKGAEEYQLLFERVLTRAAELWEAGGRFNTVTPGAKIAADQALALTMTELQNAPEPGQKLPAYLPLEDFKMQTFLPAYMDVVTGRFGANQGMDKGIGKADRKLRDAFLMYRAMEVVNAAIANGDLNNHEVELIAEELHKAKIDERIRFKADVGFDLKAEDLQQALRSTDIGQFRLALETVMEGPLKESLHYQLKPGRSPDPVEGVAEGHEVLAALRGSDVKPLRDAALIKKALGRINAALLSGEATDSERTHFQSAADIGKSGKRVTVAPLGELNRMGFKLQGEEIDKVLALSDIDKVRRAVRVFKSKSLRKNLMGDLTPLDVGVLHQEGARISDPDTAAVAAVLMRQTGKNGADDAIFRNLVSHAASSHAHSKFAHHAEAGDRDAPVQAGRSA